MKTAGATVPATGSAPVYTVHSFPPTKTGREAICSYLEVLRKLCERIERKPLNFKNWEELKNRALSYFAQWCSGATFSSKLTHDQQSQAVWKTFRDIAPSREHGTKAFRAFLAKVNAKAPAVLPIELD